MQTAEILQGAYHAWTTQSPFVVHAFESDLPAENELTLYSAGSMPEAKLLRAT